MKKRTSDVFTSTGVLISPNVREMQLDFHELRRKRATIHKALFPARKEYDTLRKMYPGKHPELTSLRDKILRANEELSFIDNEMGRLTKTVEAIHVYQRNGFNARPKVVTMGKSS